MDLALTRQAIADALNTVSGLNVRPRPITSARTNDGWVVVSRIVPADFTRTLVTFVALVILGADAAAAEQQIEALAVPVLDAATYALNGTDVALEPSTLTVGTSAAPVYALALTLTLEVD